MTERAYQQCACPFYSSRAGFFFFFGKASHHPGLPSRLQPRFSSLRLIAFPKAKIAIEMEEICECDGDIVQTLSQRRLTAYWLAPSEDLLWLAPSEDLLFTEAKKGLFWLAAKLHQGHTTSSRDIQNGTIPQKRIWEPQTPCSVKRCLSRRIHKIQWPLTLQAYLWTWHWWTVVSPIHIHVVTHTVLLTTWRCRWHHGGGCPLRGRPHIIWRRTCSNRRK